MAALNVAELDEQRRRQEEKQKKRADELEFPHRRRNKILATLFAMTAMIGYALFTGIVQVWGSPAVFAI